MTNDLFLCHTGADKDWTRAIGERLEKEQTEGRHVKVWFDEWDVAHGENIVSKIDEGLKTSRFVGVVLSPAAVAAGWPTAEWQSQVMSDPAGRLGRVLPIILHKVDPLTGSPLEMPFVLKILRYFDFSDPKRFDTELGALLRHLRGQKPSRGKGRLGAAIETTRTSQDAPDRVQESLASNLFPVLHLPAKIYSDNTSVTRYQEVWDASRGRQCPPFALSGGRILSFVPPDQADNPLKGFYSLTDPKAEATTAFLGDGDRSRLLIGMLNRLFRDHCYALDIRTPKEDREQYYCPTFDGKPRVFSWGSGRTRTLTKIVNRKGAKLGVHHSARMRFITLDAKLYLIVEPGWMFTSDGVSPLGGPEVGVLSTQWGGRERNAAVLRSLLMWGVLISQGQPEISIPCGSDRLAIRAVPAHTLLSGGLETDTIRLERLLGGEGAGEQVISDTDELEQVAEQALAGELEADDSNGPSIEGDDVPVGPDEGGDQ